MAHLSSTQLRQIEKIRQDFPVLSREVYGKPLVYFDNAATGQKPQVVLDRLQEYYAQENSNV
ncbi:MAG: aminotransferase class V-fold PLP-dependent enzyme, partial [Bacteroidota bacterium]